VSSPAPVTDLRRLRLHESVSFDICCNIPALTNSIVAQLQTQGFHFNCSALIKVIIDVPQGYALSVLEEMRSASKDKSALRFIVVTFNSCPEYLEDLWDLQPTVLLANPDYEHDLPRAIAAATRGISHRITSGQTTPLTSTERQMLRYLAHGWSNKAIASRLNLQEKTVTNNLTAIYSKLNLKNRADAILYYWGLSSVLETVSAV